MSKPSPKLRPVIQMPSALEDRQINRAALGDPDAPQLTRKQLGAMVPLRAVRGRPLSASKKQLISVRYSPEVIAYFKSTGEGWQTLMDSVLHRYVTRKIRKS